MFRCVFLSMFALAALATASGCGSTPPIDLPIPKDARVIDVRLGGDYVPFQRSPMNRYALILSGRDFAPPSDRAYSIATAEDVRREGTPVRDTFVAADVDQLTRLLVAKGYDVYRFDMGEVMPRDVEKVLDRIALVSDERTQTFFAYSGEGDAKGLRTRTLVIAPGRRVVPPDATITPIGLMERLGEIHGPKAVLLNACESGVFADDARRHPEWRGVVIAACPEGYATTPFEPTGTSAICAAFLKLYEGNPTTVKNLATERIEKAGGTWTNFRHKWSDFWGGSGKPISYEPVIYASADFLF
jgi:hypothetical protein